jgi:aspartate carbamoyltransferase catalytic subunit
MRADEHKRAIDRGRRSARGHEDLPHHLLYRLFFKESTRTYESFGFAAARLGLGVLGTQDMKSTSVAKGESLEDTIRTINCYGPSLIVMRSANVGDAAKASAVSTAPIINAGDGSGEHPTQSLLDLYTIRAETGRVHNLHLVLGGDLWNGRTVRSLVKLTSKFPGNRFTFIAPPTFEMQPDIKSRLDTAGVEYSETTALQPALAEADVVYWTRVQKERLTPDQQGFLATHPDIEKQYVIGLPEINSMRSNARLLHPLPRVGEITTDVDTDPRAAYIRQMHYGMIVRMALIEWALGYLD